MLSNAEDLKNCSISMIHSTAGYLKKSLDESDELTAALEELDSAEQLIAHAIDSQLEREQSEAAKAAELPAPEAKKEAAAPAAKSEEPFESQELARFSAEEFMDRIRTNPAAFVQELHDHAPDILEAIKDELDAEDAAL